ncbi:hypothetical protein PAPYR_10361 [Paratrimastix pyriformis]|uniref:Nudix hydrolase domain-containing protein n=1 Tax=Paratrimastix pyriformis TaxID=342808 RepID=A0ABQ8U920_9EUKA|nr:hypothetical protein PAPYR_10361 [Paratrimastix pyriformis]
MEDPQQLLDRQFITNLVLSLQRPPILFHRHGKISRRAAVALLIRTAPSPPSILFIKRALNPRDRWSGHVAFPGGHANSGETPFDACIREVFEEVGLDLAKTSFECCGQLDDCFYGGPRTHCPHLRSKTAKSLLLNGFPSKRCYRCPVLLVHLNAPLPLWLGFQSQLRGSNPTCEAAVRVEAYARGWILTTPHDCPPPRAARLLTLDEFPQTFCLWGLTLAMVVTAMEMGVGMLPPRPYPPASTANPLIATSALMIQKRLAALTNTGSGGVASSPVASAITRKTVAPDERARAALEPEMPPPQPRQRLRPFLRAPAGAVVEVTDPAPFAVQPSPSLTLEAADRHRLSVAGAASENADLVADVRLHKMAGFVPRTLVTPRYLIPNVRVARLYGVFVRLSHAVKWARQAFACGRCRRAKKRVSVATPSTSGLELEDEPVPLRL